MRTLVPLEWKKTPNTWESCSLFLSLKITPWDTSAVEAPSSLLCGRIHVGSLKQHVHFILCFVQPEVVKPVKRLLHIFSIAAFF